MEKATYESIQFVESDNIQMQGNRSKVESFLKRGYYIQEEKNGYWVLVKPAEILVTLTNSQGSKSFNIKQSVLDHYNRHRISMSLVETFKSDVNNGKITFEMDEECATYLIKSVSI